MTANSRSRRAPEERRAQILDEALRLIGEQGYHGFTIQALGRRCGLSNAGLLHYFGSKDALLLGLLEAIGEREALVVAPLLADTSGGLGRDKLVHVLRAIGKSAAAKPEVSRFTVLLMAESISPRHPAHDWFRQRQDEAHRLLVALCQGWCDEPERVARQLQAMLYGLLLQWLRPPHGFDLKAEWALAMDAVIARGENRG